MVQELMITSKEQIFKINELASHAPYEVWLSDNSILLDARSLLGLFALLGKKAHVVVEDDIDPKVVNRLVRKMA